MKQHTQNFKNEIKKIGRQFDDSITYYYNGELIILKDELYSVVPHYEGNILKSVMKQLDVESKIDIPKNTQITYNLGLLVNGNYEYINFGNYIVFSSEKQEDTNVYKIVCYDKMLYSMKNYENMNLTYPISVRNYISNLANYLGLNFANTNGTFANWNKTITSDLYLDSGGNDIGYTFRDVLDELAQVTASTICINENDELEIRYINDTLDTIDEEFFKDVNVKFGEKFGPINSIVLSRSGESDNVFLKDDTSILQNGLCEIKIVDNQIMNNNDRSDYLEDIFAKLKDLEYYINDFSSTGILYYELCDRYIIKIGNNQYNCIMFNNEINRKSGLEELVYTEMPQESETDYTKSDETDRRINRTYLIVDKQNQKIEAIINNVTDQNNKISQITQTVDELNSKISDIADITTYGESSYASVDLDDINESEPIMIKVHPNIVNISYLYPRNNLYPSNTLYMTDRKIRFTNNTNNTYFDYELPDDLLYYDANNYDEFYLDYDSQTCQITKKCKYNADGTVGLLANEVVTDYPYPTILLEDGDYTISLLGYDYGYIFVRLVASNIYTSQFATKVEMNSAITQKANEINATVSLKLNEEDFTHASIVAKINDDTSQVLIEADKIHLQANDVIDILAGNTINLTSKTIAITSTNFSVTSNGTVTMKNANVTGTLANYNTSTGKLAVKISNQIIRLYNWESNGEWVGALASVNDAVNHVGGISLFCQEGDKLVLGYRESESSGIINILMQFNTADTTSVPYIKNTASGHIFPNHSDGGITVKNGLITNWNLDTYSGNIFSSLDGGGISVKNGIVTGWNLTGTYNGSFYFDCGTSRYKVYVKYGLITNIEFYERIN